jgi:hypothetical protein
MGKPYLREGDEKDSVWMYSFNLAVPDIGEVQGQKSLFNILNRCGRPEKFENDALPYLFLGGAIKE